MSDTSLVPVSAKNAAVEYLEGDQLALTAVASGELADCQAALIQWTERKIQQLKNEHAELHGAYDHAVKHKWKSGTLKKHAEMVLKRVTFYDKMLAALRAGYCIVPNFPVTLIAIRTGKDKPAKMMTTSSWDDFQQPAQVLPQGVGVYKNPNPTVRKGWERTKITAEGKTVKVNDYWAEAWQAMDFPVNMAKLYVMEAATRAMGLKLFDEIGLFPEDYKRNPDPVLVGRLIDPRGDRHRWRHTRVVSFMLAWHVDTRTL